MRRGTPHLTDETVIASLFDSESMRYDAGYEAVGGHVLRARLGAVIEALGPGPGKVLDGGMGPGRLCVELDRRGWEVSGVDLSGDMVELARRRIPDARERLVHGTLEALPFGDASFDAAAAMGVLEYLDDVPAALREFARVLRPGGSLVVTVPYLLSLQGLWRRHVWYPSARVVKRAVPGFSRPAPYRKPAVTTKRALASALREAGLHPQETRHVGYVVLPVGLGGRAGRMGARVASRFESAKPNGARPLATQVVMLVHKPGSPGAGAPAQDRNVSEEELAPGGQAGSPR